MFVTGQFSMQLRSPKVYLTGLLAVAAVSLAVVFFASSGQKTAKVRQPAPIATAPVAPAMQAMPTMTAAGPSVAPSPLNGCEGGTDPCGDDAVPPILAGAASPAVPVAPPKNGLARTKKVADRQVAEPKSQPKPSAGSPTRPADKSVAETMTAAAPAPKPKAAGLDAMTAKPAELGADWMMKQQAKRSTGVAPAETARSKANARARAALGAGGRYVVIGSFASLANATALAERHRQWGAAVIPIEVNGRTRQRVLIGPFDAAELKQALGRIAQAGIADAWALPGSARLDEQVRAASVQR